MQHRYNFGIVGNCSFNALIGDSAKVKWLCWPKFDSSFIFGSLLDEKSGGEYSVESSAKDTVTQQEYLENTNILVTSYVSELGSFEVIDFAPRFLLNDRMHKPNMLFRKIKKTSGAPRVKIICSPVGSYGEKIPEKILGSSHIRFEGLDEPVRLTTNASLQYILNEQEFSLNEDLYLVLSWGPPLEGPLVSTFEDFFYRTKRYWRDWVERCTLPRIFQREVIRSALVLKLHQYEDTGGIIASCTTSLPEIPGEERNWDYRYVWLRDTYYTISAFNSLGHFSEVEKYAHFIENIDPSEQSYLQPVYCVDGNSDVSEYCLNLAGYLDNKPVRIGNAASLQIQNDGYGQVILALFQLYTDARTRERGRVTMRTLNKLLECIEDTMEQPDNGVWEFREKKAVHSYTLLFHWAGSAACMKIAEAIHDNELFSKAQKTKKRAAELLWSTYSEPKKAFTQSKDSQDLDASLIQIITLGFLDDNPKQIALDHLNAIQRELEIEKGFLLRYKHGDDFGKQKSAFLVCSFWMVEALVYLDEIEKAKEIFDGLLKVQNHLGLMSEAYDTVTRSQWGNFPQTYSHVGLINCAFAFDRAIKKPGFL